MSESITRFSYQYALIAGMLLIFSGCSSPAIVTSDQDSQQGIEQKVDSVLYLMTLKEKIGQMTLYTSDFDQTGPTVREGYIQDIRAGRVGAIFNA